MVDTLSALNFYYCHVENQEITNVETIQGPKVVLYPKLKNIKNITLNAIKVVNTSNIDITDMTISYGGSESNYSYEKQSGSQPGTACNDPVTLYLQVGYLQISVFDFKDNFLFNQETHDLKTTVSQTVKVIFNSPVKPNESIIFDFSSFTLNWPNCPDKSDNTAKSCKTYLDCSATPGLPPFGACCNGFCEDYCIGLSTMFFQITIKNVTPETYSQGGSGSGTQGGGSDNDGQDTAGVQLTIIEVLFALRYFLIFLFFIIIMFEIYSKVKAKYKK